MARVRPQGGRDMGRVWPPVGRSRSKHWCYNYLSCKWERCAGGMISSKEKKIMILIEFDGHE